MRPSVQDIKKIWDWTQNDIEDLFKSFYINRSPGEGGYGPSSGYSIFLFSLMDIWGSIITDNFNVRKRSSKNIVEILKRLRSKYSSNYEFGRGKLEEVADELRNNLVHCYGLRFLDSGKKVEWLNIDVNNVGSIINIQNNKRWHIDCMRLKDHLLEIIEDWLKTNNYI